MNTLPSDDDLSPNVGPIFPVVEIEMSELNSFFTPIDISLAISLLTAPYFCILFLSIFKISTFELSEYVTTPPKKILETPSFDTIVDATLPP